MNKTKLSRGNIILYVVLVVLIILLFIPSTRSLLQQGLMKLGLFKPTLEAPVEKAPDTPVVAQVSSSFSNEKGEIINTASLKGKVVFINFWATWCGPCIQEMPSIQVLHDKLKDNPNVEFLLVEIDHENELAKEFMEKEKLNMPIYFPEGDIPNTWLGQSIPVTVILDKEGNIAARHEGMADYSTKQVEQFIVDLSNK
ncbi:TlpA family protein disulfide reductase [Sphingobacterium hungaricum]|uniref:TlpA family protein disulfide reductase n=1 Tax=Sphingobacterium hungaricum TaxID=2082723 RepID=A0A928V0N3_9SPHI|nr:TlpA disulfide reductase family protein [Sphingobacterium hungaricum]MBE8714935.1 TlpA family protein disulfide reductase [Sphingobacterium hungaricum]